MRHTRTLSRLSIVTALFCSGTLFLSFCAAADEYGTSDRPVLQKTVFTQNIKTLMHKVDDDDWDDDDWDDDDDDWDDDDWDDDDDDWDDRDRRYQRRRHHDRYYDRDDYDDYRWRRGRRGDSDDYSDDREDDEPWDDD